MINVLTIDPDYEKTATITKEFAEWVNHNFGIYRDENGVLKNHISKEGDNMAETIEYIRQQQKKMDEKVN